MAPAEEVMISDIAFQQAGALTLGTDDVVRRDVVVAVVVEGVDDDCPEHRSKADAGHQPHLPDQSETADRTECSDDESGSRVLWHVDRRKALLRPDVIVALHI